MEEALYSLRRTFYSRWHQVSKLLSRKSANKRAPLLEIPPEIRLVIYNYIDPDSSFTHLAANPLYRLMFVCKSLQHEVSSLFYATPSFTFQDPRTCRFFFTTATTHLHLLTTLTLCLCGDEIYALEPIFGLLIERNVPLRSLVLKLMLALGETNPKNLPPGRRVSADAGKEVLSEARARARRLSASFGKELLSLPEPMLRSSTESQDLKSSNCTTGIWRSTLGAMRSIRYLAIDGHPSGHWAAEFELAILELHSRMFEVAKEDGKKVLKGPSPLPPGVTHDRYWLHNDVWIEGEEKPASTDFLRENYGPWRGPRGAQL